MQYLDVKGDLIVLHPASYTSIKCGQTRLEGEDEEKCRILKISIDGWL